MNTAVRTIEVRSYNRRLPEKKMTPNQLRILAELQEEGVSFLCVCALENAMVEFGYAPEGRS